MFCKECGEQIDDDSKFCPECGAAQEQRPEADADAEPMPYAQPAKRAAAPADLTDADEPVIGHVKTALATGC